MIRHRKHISLLLMTFVALCVAYPLRAANTLSATQVLDKVVKTIRDTPSINMKMSVQNGSSTFKAELTVAHSKFAYNAGPLLVLFDGISQWTLDADSKEVSLTDPTPEEIAETNPLAFVSNYKNNYNVSLTKSGEGSYNIKMTALDKSSFVRSAQVVISSTTWLPTHITAQLSTGQTLTIRVNATEKGAEIPIAKFRYDSKTYPGYELIDLR